MGFIKHPGLCNEKTGSLKTGGMNSVLIRFGDVCIPLMESSLVKSAISLPLSQSLGLQSFRLATRAVSLLGMVLKSYSKVGETDSILMRFRVVVLLRWRSVATGTGRQREAMSLFIF